MIYWILLVTFLAGVVGTGLGGLISALIKRDSTKVVSLLLSLAAGVMLAVVCFDLIVEALNPVEGFSVPVYVVALGILVGYGVVFALNYIIDRNTNPEVSHIDASHPKTADDLGELIHADHLKVHRENNNKLFVAGIIMAAAIALHNLPEGMVIGAAYSGEGVQDVWSGSGFLMAMLLGFHNIPEGMAVAVPLIAGGMKKSRAILVTSLSGFPTVIGALIGYWLGSMGPIMQTLSLGFASGAMLYVIMGELLPQSILMWKSKMPAVATTVGLILGMFLIF